ncbi:N-acetyltransferase [Aeromicrobium flavum]|uniref:N-acetyltransferase n=1 Tax=Aeromicrobium flavum TaxID=416568 RepID=A0A512HX43_9ACTN|nr:GNAT family N-acetyltransferase [Aeromicrobium flavum]GEO89999.1 N-acetyltransferase [Aeromicrobium flavum]
MTLTIAPVSPGDWRRWRAVRTRALDEDPAAFACSAHAWIEGGDTEERWRARIAARGRLFLATDEHGRDVGMIGLTADEEPELISMWVAPEARRAGAGRQLVETVLQVAGSRPVRLRVMADNRDAIAFYAGCGFVLTGDRPDAEDTLTMRRVATPAATGWPASAARPLRPGGPPPGRSADQ